MINDTRKILVFSHSSQLGGAERSILDLVDLLKIHGFFFHFIIPSAGGIEKELKKRSVSYNIIDYCWWASKKEVKDRIFQQSFNNVVLSFPEILRFKPDCIISNSAIIPWGAITAQLLDRPHIWNIREFVEKDHGLIPKVTFPELARFVYNTTDKIWFVSKAVKREFENYIPSDKSSVVYSQLDIPRELFVKKIKSPFKYKNSFRLIIAGAIERNKGQDQAINATKLLVDSGYDIELLILGGNNKKTPYYWLLRRLVLEKYGTRIHFVNFINNPYPYFRLSHLVLLCSKSEAFSRSIIEGGILGKSFVASNTGGNKEIFKGDNGLLYSYGDYRDLASKIKIFLEDNSLYRRYSDNHKILYIESLKPTGFY